MSLRFDHCADDSNLCKKSLHLGIEEFEKMQGKKTVLWSEVLVVERGRSI